ncbi:MAG: hypothetical protein R2741_09550 [Methanolobus sp.]
MSGDESTSIVGSGNLIFILVPTIMEAALINASNDTEIPIRFEHYYFTNVLIHRC